MQWGLSTKLAIAAGTCACVSLPVVAMTWLSTPEDSISRAPTASSTVSIEGPSSPQTSSPVVLPERIFPKTRRGQAVQACMDAGDSFDEALEEWMFINAQEIALPETLAIAIGQLPEGKRPLIHYGDFTGKDMRDLAPLLSGACIQGMDLTDTNWSGVKVTDLRLLGVNINGLKAKGADLPGLSLNTMYMRDSDFSGANLTDFRFVSSGASFRGVSFKSANLTGATFACGITSDVWCINGSPDIRDADLTRADVSGLGLWDAENNTGAILNQTVIAPGSLAYVAEAKINGPLTLATEFTSPYHRVDEEYDRPPSARISAQEARDLIAATLSVSGEEADKASFDCAKANTSVEEIICGEYDSDLRALDREMAKSWEEARAAGKASLTEQRRWLRTRAQCEDRVCLRESYVSRIAQLRSVAGTGLNLKEGEIRSFHSDVIPLPETARSGALYERILVTLKDASYQEVILTGLGYGRVRAKGEAVGGNAHLCTLYAGELQFDPETGWWSSMGEGEPIQVFRVDGRRLILRYHGTYSDPEEVRGLFACGARASFSDGIDLTPG